MIYTLLVGLAAIEPDVYFVRRLFNQVGASKAIRA